MGEGAWGRYKTKGFFSGEGAHFFALNFRSHRIMGHAILLNAKQIFVALPPVSRIPPCRAAGIRHRPEASPSSGPGELRK